MRPFEWVFLTKSKLRWDHHLWVNFGNASCVMTAKIYPPKSVLRIQSFCFAYFLFSVIIVVALSLLVAFLCKHFLYATIRLEKPMIWWKMCRLEINVCRYIQTEAQLNCRSLQTCICVDHYKSKIIIDVYIVLQNEWI